MNSSINIMHRLVIAILLLLTTGISTAYPVHSENTLCDEAKSKMIEIFKICVELYRDHVDVSSILDRLNYVDKLIKSGQCSKALDELAELSNNVKILKENAYSIKLRYELTRYSLVAFLLSIPVLVYFLLPRLYLYIWYRTHRKWIVEGSKK